MSLRHSYTEPVFCYGTLQLPRYQRRLFGRSIPATPAILRGWQLRMGFDGYRFICPSPHKTLRGSLIWLTPQQLKIADRWEDVPYYQREKVTVRARYRGANIWAYTRRRGKGRSCPARLFTMHSSIRLVLRGHRYRFQ